MRSIIKGFAGARKYRISLRIFEIFVVVVVAIAVDQNLAKGNYLWTFFQLLNLAWLVPGVRRYAFGKSWFDEKGIDSPSRK